LYGETGRPQHLDDGGDLGVSFEHIGDAVARVLVRIEREHSLVRGGHVTKAITREEMIVIKGLQSAGTHLNDLLQEKSERRISKPDKDSKFGH
jgi:hypothetical protein